MFCKKCGKQLSDDAKFCGGCGSAVTQNVSAGETIVPEEVPEKPVAPAYPKNEETKTKSGVTAVMIALGAAIAALIAVIVILLVNRGGEPSKKGMDLVIDSIPAETDSVSYTISGIVSSYDENAVLTVDGYEVAFLQAGEENVSWSKEVWLSEGTNSFEIELVPDNGEKITETVEIEYSPSLLYEEGTVLIKSDPAGIFIRPTPAITKEYILYLPYYDFDTQLVCQGEEYRDGEGFIWCKVQIPDGKIGWVRSDIVKRY